MTVQEFFADMKDHFISGMVDKEYSFYFSLGEKPGEKWTVFVGPKSCRVEEGKTADNADCVLKTTSDFFLKMILEGYTPGVMDFTRGRIKSNNPMLLQKIKEAFDY